MAEEICLRWNYKKAHVLLRVKQHKKEGKWLWEGREGMAYLNVKFRTQEFWYNIRVMRTADTRLMTIRLPNPSKKSPKCNSLILVHPKSQSIFPKSQLIPTPHSSHPNLVTRLILDYSDDPDLSPTQFLQQNPLSQIVEEEGPSSMQFFVTCL